MLIVAIDTSSREGSVALCRGDANSFEVLGLRGIDGGTYSARLIPCITELLAGALLLKEQIDGFVVVDGPGSFTGLRVGLATTKALCDVLEKPLVTVSMLEALAVTYARADEIVIAVLDAGRGEMYAGEYSVSGHRANLRNQGILKLADFEVCIAGSPPRVITTSPKIAGDIVIPLRADAVARIGLRKLLANDVVDPLTLDANYIRRSDAELFSTPK